MIETRAFFHAGGLKFIRKTWTGEKLDAAKSWADKENIYDTISWVVLVDPDNISVPARQEWYHPTGQEWKCLRG